MIQCSDDVLIQAAFQRYINPRFEKDNKVKERIRKNNFTLKNLVVSSWFYLFTFSLANDDGLQPLLPQLCMGVVAQV